MFIFYNVAKAKAGARQVERVETSGGSGMTTIGGVGTDDTVTPLGRDGPKLSESLIKRIALISRILKRKEKEQERVLEEKF